MEVSMFQVVAMGLCTVFAVLVCLIIIITIMGKIMEKKQAPAKAAAPAPAAPAAPAAPKEKAPGSAGSIDLHGVDPRKAAMIMAIVADELGKPINELRFISIREIEA